MILARNLLRTLHGREIATETGLTHRAVADSERVTEPIAAACNLPAGALRCLTTAWASCLVPWKPVIEQHLGQTMTAVMRGRGVSWEFGPQRRPSVV